VIRSFLLELLKQEVLITSLRPPTTVPSPLAHVLRALESVAGIEGIREQLVAIDRKLNQYDGIPLAERESLLRQIKAEMTAIVSFETPLQADMALAADELELPHVVSDEVARAADLLWKLQGIHSKSTALEAYRSEFLEKYGYDREVPLLELLDEETGLGAPADYDFPQSQRTHQPTAGSERKLNRVLLQWATSAVAERRLEVELTDAHVQALLEGSASPSADLPPLSLELYFTLTADSNAALESGDFRLVTVPNPGSKGAGKTFGRFAALQPEPVVAEVAYLPLSGRATNIVLAPNIRSYEIPLGTTSSRPPEETIALHDLVVGSTQRHLYLKSRRLNREVWATAGHMLNLRLAPNVCRFIVEVSQLRRRTWSTFHWAAAESAPFLPRLRYGRVILSPAKWRLDKNSGAFQEQMSDEAWKHELAAWRSRWQVPRYVYLTEADNRLLLDLEHELQAEQIRKELFRKGEVLLVELEGDFERFPVQGPDGPMIGEFVFPLVRKQVAPPEDSPRATCPFHRKRCARTCLAVNGCT
jgi:lantibiotic biosynthesis protein